jgi:hypothetical protein
MSDNKPVEASSESSLTGERLYFEGQRATMAQGGAVRTDAVARPASVSPSTGTVARDHLQQQQDLVRQHQDRTGYRHPLERAPLEGWGRHMESGPSIANKGSEK